MLLNLIISNLVFKNIDILIYKKQFKFLNYYFFYKNSYINFIINFLIKHKINYKLNYMITNFNALILYEFYIKKIFYKIIKNDIFINHTKINVISFNNFKMKIDVVSFLLLLHYVESFRRVKYNEYICNGLFLSTKIINSLAKVPYNKDCLLSQWKNLKHIFYFQIWNNSYVYYYLKSYSCRFPLIINKYFIYLLKKYDISLIFVKNFFNKYLKVFYFCFSRFFIIFFFYNFIMFRGKFASSRFLARLKYTKYKHVLKANTSYSWNIRMFRIFLFLKTWYYKSVKKDIFLLDFYNYEYVNMTKYRFYYNILIVFFVKFLKGFLNLFLFDFLTYTVNLKELIKFLVSVQFLSFINLKNMHWFLSKLDVCLWKIYESDVIKQFYFNCLTLSNYYRKLDFDNIVISRIFLFFYYFRIRFRSGNFDNINNFNLLFFYYFFNSLFQMLIKKTIKYYIIFNNIFLLQYYFNLINWILLTIFYDMYVAKNLLKHYD